MRSHVRLRTKKSAARKSSQADLNGRPDHLTRVPLRPNDYRSGDLYQMPGSIGADTQRIRDGFPIYTFPADRSGRRRVVVSSDLHTRLRIADAQSRSEMIFIRGGHNRQLLSFEASLVEVNEQAAPGYFGISIQILEENGLCLLEPYAEGAAEISFVWKTHLPCGQQKRIISAQMLALALLMTTALLLLLSQFSGFSFSRKLPLRHAMRIVEW